MSKKWFGAQMMCSPAREAGADEQQTLCRQERLERYNYKGLMKSNRYDFDGLQFAKKEPRKGVKRNDGYP